MRIDAEAEAVLIKVVRGVEVLKKGAAEDVEVAIFPIEAALRQDEVALAAVDLPEVLLRLESEHH